MDDKRECDRWWVWLLPLLLLGVVWLWRRRVGVPCCARSVPAPVPKRFSVELPAPSAIPPAPTVSFLPDDLKRIEGIGPKISALLQSAGITTFAQLAAADIARLTEVLAEGGIRRIADPTTWPEQAALAARSDWEMLAVLQSELKGGRRV